MGSYVKGFILIIGGTIVILKSHVFLALMYSLTGRVVLAEEVLDTRWLLLFAPIYLYAIWGTYRITVELNKYSILGDREDSAIVPIKDKRYRDKLFRQAEPLGGGSLVITDARASATCTTHRIPTSFFLLTWWVGISYLSHLLPGHPLYTMMGQFQQATSGYRTGVVPVPGAYLYILRL